MSFLAIAFSLVSVAGTLSGPAFTGRASATAPLLQAARGRALALASAPCVSPGNRIPAAPQDPDGIAGAEGAPASGRDEDVAPAAASSGTADGFHLDDRISIHFDNMTLDNGLRMLFKHVGADFSLDETVRGARVTVSVRDQPFPVALQTVLNSSPIPLTYRVEDSVYYIWPRGRPMVGNAARTAGPQAPRRKEVETIKRRIQHQDANEIARRLAKAMPQYARDIRAVEIDNSLVIVGDRKEQTEIGRAVGHLDLPPRAIDLEMRVIRMDTDGAGGWDVDTVARMTAVTIDNLETRCTVTGSSTVAVWAVPHVRPDGAITVDANLRVTNGGAQSAVGAGQRSLRSGVRTVILGITNSTNNAVRAAVHACRLVLDGGAHTDYYLQITARLTNRPPLPAVP